MDKQAEDAGFAETICFSDEATFMLHGEVHRHNCRYWSQENPHWMEATRTQHPQKLNVWAGIRGNHIIGPFFITGNLTGAVYLNLLRDSVLPGIADVAGDARTWFQQDGAPAHYALDVRQYLNENFPNSWIGRMGTVEWPARSPDLSLLDFFYWGHLKSVVYNPARPQDLQELKERITAASDSITPVQLQHVREHFLDRMAHCRFQNGHHFEHLL